MMHPNFPFEKQINNIIKVIKKYWNSKFVTLIKLASIWYDRPDQLNDSPLLITSLHLGDPGFSTPSELFVISF